MMSPWNILRRARALFLGLLWTALGLGPVAGATAAGAAPADVRRDAVVEAVERVMPSVVNIGTITLVERGDAFGDLLREFYGPYYRRRRPQEVYSLGSGVIIDEDGYVLTNVHVVDQATRIRVRLMDGREFDAERVAGVGRSDVALLKLVTSAQEKFRAIQFARDDDLLLGETVLALGNPFGLGGSVSRGILSSKNRRPPQEKEPLDVPDWLQTDAAINIGNSGGPLVNARGELIGLNVAVYRSGQGIGFAIPIKQVNQALAQIFTPETIRSLWFGARLRPSTNGVTVVAVDTSSPAAKAGLAARDEIREVNGKSVNGLVAFYRELIAAGEQKEVSLGFTRGPRKLAATVRLVPEAAFFNADLVRKRIGASVQALTADIAERLGLEPEGGLMISGVERDSPAAAAGLVRGIVIRSADGLPADDLTALARVLHGKKNGERVALAIVWVQRYGNLVSTQDRVVEVAVQ